MDENTDLFVFQTFFLALREMGGKIDNSICATSSLLECLGPLTHPLLAWNNIIYISHSNLISTFHKSFDYRCLSRPIKGSAMRPSNGYIQTVAIKAEPGIAHSAPILYSTYIY